MIALTPNTIDRQINKLINTETITDLSEVKSDQKGFQLQFISSAIRVTKSLQTIYSFCKEFLPSLKISNNCICD